MNGILVDGSCKLQQDRPRKHDSWKKTHTKRRCSSAVSEWSSSSMPQSTPPTAQPENPTSIDLYWWARPDDPASIDLYWLGRPDRRASIDLYCRARPDHPANIDLYCLGRPDSRASIDLYLGGFLGSGVASSACACRGLFIVALAGNKTS